MVELMVALAIILIITAAASTAYVKLLGGVKVQGRITEGQMDTLSGFELLRYDIEMAGYGLFRELPPAAESGCTGPSSPDFYDEAVASDAPNAADFNDDPGEVPRAFFLSNNTGNTLPGYLPDDNASDVLVIKSMVANAQALNRKWSFLDSNRTIKSWGSTELDFADNDTVVALDETGRLRICSNWQDATSASMLPLPSEGTTYVVYGVNASTMRMPFNRVDYYLKQPASNFPSRCFAGSFILYRASINHGDGGRNEQPLIDCVRDFQVAFGIDTDGDRAVNTWVTNPSLTAAEIRTQVREVRVFLLYHEGQRDKDFCFSGTINLGDVDIATQLVGNTGFQTLSDTPEEGALSTFTPPNTPPCQDEKTHYRWKVGKLVIKPMNLD